MQKKEWMKNKK